MDTYIVLITLIGFAALGMAWMPAFTKRTGISYSILYVLTGIVLYLIIPQYLPRPDPIKNNILTLRLSEMVVIISLMGTGLKIDRRFSFKNWSSPIRLIIFAMLLCIASAAFLGYNLLGLDLASAVLIGAALAPTDPVLASDVQVGPPNNGKKSETKFSLTAEAGLNDGMAFPFVWLAIIMAMRAAGKEIDYLHWFSFYLIYKIGIAFLIGFVLGKMVGFVIFRFSRKFSFFKTQDGFLAIALTFIVYGITELLSGYGFIAVFICAFSLRHYEKNHGYHEELHSFTDQAERLLVAVLLILFGGSLVTGILDHLTVNMVIFSLVFLFIIRPVAAFLSIFSSDFHIKEKMAISFFGIRGMGTIFYISFAIQETWFHDKEELWSIVAFTILISVMIHGLTATPVMKYLKRHIEKGDTPL